MKITELYAWVATHENGSEGLIAAIMPGLGTTPLISSQRHFAEALRDRAEEAARRGIPEEDGKVIGVRLATYRLV